MSDTPRRLDNRRRLANVALLAGAIVGLALLVLAVWQSRQPLEEVVSAGAGYMPILLGCAGILVVLASAVAWGVVYVLFKLERTFFHSHDVLLDIQELLRGQQLKLGEIAENVQLSDATKSIARREKERKALHEAIQDEILRGNWDAAYYLVDELEKRFGYRGEAGRLREEIDAWRGRAKEQRLLQAIKQVDAATEAHDWRRAKLIAAQIAEVFPDDQRAVNLDVRIRDAFERRKHELLAAWRESVQNHQIEKSLEILKELDHYLTAQEAQDLREPARAVFRERMQSLGAQFTAAYKSKQWAAALAAGERIQAEFPTSKMAEEVRVLMRGIRQKLEPQPVSATGAG
jgi:outer membrane protein assembly factor BamD (BamD/ComL family)